MKSIYNYVTTLYAEMQNTGILYRLNDWAICAWAFFPDNWYTVFVLNTANESSTVQSIFMYRLF